MASRNSWKTQFEQIGSSSQFHETVRNIFRTDPYFKRLKCFQEVNVRDLVPDYEHHNHHYDWYVEELNMVIELHGRQHYHVTNFGDLSAAAAKKNFRNMQARDNMKKYAATSAGYFYVEIPYTLKNKLNNETLKELLIGD